MRPSSSSGFTSRPSTSHSIRSASRFSQRPSSALSHRPGSSLSQRPTSRLSQRPPSRHAQRFASQLGKLVENVTGLSADDEEDYEDAFDLALRTLETNRYTGLRVNLDDVEARIEGLIEKAQIKGQDVMATALSETRTRLKNTVQEVSATTDEPLVRESLLPDHIHFLLLLANAPNFVTQAAAADILHSIRNPPSPPHVLTWEDILAEEPFEGEHWRMPPSPSSSSLSSWSDLPSKQQLVDSEDSTSAAEDSISSESPDLRPDEGEASNKGEPNDDPQGTIDALQQQQYWTNQSPLKDTPFNLGDPSTLGPAFASLGKPLSGPRVYISELNAVREALMALQGCYGYLFQLDPGSHQVQIVPSAPVLPQISPGTFRSLLSAFASTATTLAQLRRFIQFTRLQEVTYGVTYRCRTLSAFSEGVEVVLSDFATWCSDIEMQLCRAQAGSGPEMIVSLLSLRHKLQQRANATFDILWLIARKFCATTNTPSDKELQLPDPCSSAQYILDQLLAYSHSHASMGDPKTAASLMRVFVYAITPLWCSLHLWLKNGVPSMGPLDDRYGSIDGIIHDSEFFIEINDGLLTSADSWHEACTLRSTPNTVDDGVPGFLQTIGSQLLSAGKAVGLLRALGTEDFFYKTGEDGSALEWLADWLDAQTLFGDGPLKEGVSVRLAALANENTLPPTTKPPQLARNDPDGQRKGLWAEEVSTRATHYLLPLCGSAQARLNRVVVEESRLWDHLRAIEDVYLMRRGDIMAEFCDILYSRMDAGLPWNDFHFLNGAFRDSLAASSCRWLDASLMRMSYQATGRDSIARTVAALEGLTLDYQVPFPLNYMLGPASIRSYCKIFVLLLQLRRCNVILRSLDFNCSRYPNSNITNEALRAFYGLKAKLVCIYYNHIVTYVLRDETQRLHEVLASANSLDQMVSQHSAYLDRVLRQCFLLPESDAAHKAVVAILDVTLTARRCFDTASSDVSIDLSSLAMRDERLAERGRRQKQRLRQSQKRLRRNVISFTSETVDTQLADSSSDSSEDLDLSYLSTAMDEQQPDASGGLTGNSWLSRIDDCNVRLDNLMRLLARSVEALSGAAEGSLKTYAILAFSLEDWDR
ncbi:hypothetical protein M407DRAFT_19953 [Tulasnella calospora MUT 4182]|uniref:Spindle pole body component n=1 Tax=Tulasnella calospora MUT 4182 TaxID=1051891 RepID=A0A0C3LB25_9AGAM|nr:hypothetical protein M407DRAFT_19953 [Tulasnella calospora MUT 4182]